MAILTNGILGTLRGRIGPLVFSNRNGITIVSRRPNRRRKSHPALLAQHAKFRLCMQFLNPLRKLLNHSYVQPANRKPGFNKAFSYHVKYALTGDYPDAKIDFAKVLLSKGRLPKPGSPACELKEDGLLTFSWTSHCELALAKPDDKAFVAIYSPSLDQWIYRKDAASRIAGTASMDISCFSGQPVQTYLGFIAANGKMASDSIYTGELLP
jgi:hypothetical protein